MGGRLATCCGDPPSYHDDTTSLPDDKTILSNDKITLQSRPFLLHDLPQDVCYVVLTFLTGRELYLTSRQVFLRPLTSAITYRRIVQVCTRENEDTRRVARASFPSWYGDDGNDVSATTTEEDREDLVNHQPWGRGLHEKLAFSWGVTMHVPSKERLLRILYYNTEDAMICDTCRQKKPCVVYMRWWGLFLCPFCSDMAEYSERYESERHGHDERVYSRYHTGSRSYFVRWSCDDMARFLSYSSSTHVAVHCGVALEKPVVDPYTNEPCGPIVSQRDIDVMITSGQSIESFWSFLEGSLQSKLKPLLEAAKATHHQQMKRLAAGAEPLK